MAINIIEADLDTQLETAMELLNENRSHKTDIKRFEWLYLKNPYGRAITWFAVDDKTGSIAGFTSALPRKMRVFGEEIICWNCSDFSINKKYRTLGVAIKLRKAAKLSVDSNRITFLYAHPNDRMRVIHLKVGHNEMGKMMRLAKPLRVDYKVKERIKNPVLAKPVSALGNVVLKLKDKRLPASSSFQFKVYSDKEFRFDSQFDKLFNTVSDSSGIFGVRDSEYLNWRYIDCPLTSFNIGTLTDRDNLLGYVVFYVEDSIAVMKDIFSVNDRDVKTSLLANWLNYLNEKKINSATATFLTSNLWVEDFKGAGFVPRDDSTSSVIVYSNSDYKYSKELLDDKNWYMTVGDRDV